MYDDVMKELKIRRSMNWVQILSEDAVAHTCFEGG